jgi:hypothetical protein
MTASGWGSAVVADDQGRRFVLHQSRTAPLSPPPAGASWLVLRAPEDIEDIEDLWQALDVAVQASADRTADVGEDGSIGPIGRL